MGLNLYDAGGVRLEEGAVVGKVATWIKRIDPADEDYDLAIAAATRLAYAASKVAGQWKTEDVSWANETRTSRDFMDAMQAMEKLPRTARLGLIMSELRRLHDIGQDKDIARIIEPYKALYLVSQLEK